MAVVDPEVERNLAQQATLYGEPLGPLLRRLCEHFGITQARMAEVLGLSAPMLSQLMSGRRVKIGNPAVVARLQHLVELARSGGTLPPEAAAEQLREVQEAERTLTGSRPTAVDPSTLLGGLRSLASPEQLRASAQAVAPIAPALADVLGKAAGGRRG